MADMNFNLDPPRQRSRSQIQEQKSDGYATTAVAVQEDSRLPTLLKQLRQKLEDNEKCAGHVRLQDDEFLSMFLRVKDYDLDRALQAVEKYYRHFETFPELLVGIRTSSQYKSVYDDKIFMVLKGKCKRGSTVCLLRMSAWDVTKHHHRTVRQANLFIAQEMVQSLDLQLSGGTMIVDLKNFSFAHLRQFKPVDDMKFFVQTCQDGIPFRVAAVHLINYPAIFLGLYYIAYGFLKEKLRSRIYWHKSTASLHEHIDRDVLPKDLGGTRDTENVEDATIEQRLVQNDRHYADYYL